MTLKISHYQQSCNATYPPSMSLTTRLIFKAISVLTDVSRYSDGTINRRLISYVSPHFPSSLRPYSGVHTSDITINTSSNLKIRVFVPTFASSTCLPLIIFFHGGGFAYLSAMSILYDQVCRRYCREIVAVVVSVDYRLSPEHRCPAPYDDGMEVLRYLDSGDIQLDEVMEGIELDLSSCFLMGDSAGANIAHHVAEPANWNRIKLAGLISIQPFFGGEERTESEIRLEGAPLVSIERTDWMWKAFLPEGADRNHEAAHVFSPATELGNAFPPIMVVIGGYDPLQDWQRRYSEMLKQKGKDVQVINYPSAVHAFYVLPLGETKQLIGDIMKFVKAKSC